MLIWELDLNIVNNHISQKLNHKVKAQLWFYISLECLGETHVPALFITCLLTNAYKYKKRYCFFSLLVFDKKNAKMKLHLTLFVST